MMKSSTSERLKELMKERHLRQVDILEKCKPFFDVLDIRLNKSDLSQYVNGKVKPDQKKLTLLAHALDVNEPWLMGYDVAQTPKAITEPVPDLSFLEKIPLLGSSACGLPIQANREYDYIDIGPAKRADFALTAEGRSMVNAGILDGSIVLFEETERVDNGTIAAVTVGDSTTIKKFYQYGDTVILRPCNPEFQDQEYSGDDLEMIHVFGRAVGSFNKY